MAAFREMEEVSSWLLSLLGANHVEKQQRQLLGRHEQMVERLLETQDGADQRLRGEGGAPALQPRGTSRWELATPGPQFPHRTVAIAQMLTDKCQSSRWQTVREL